MTPGDTHKSFVVVGVSGGLRGCRLLRRTPGLTLTDTRTSPLLPPSAPSTPRRTGRDYDPEGLGGCTGHRVNESPPRTPPAPDRDRTPPTARKRARHLGEWSTSDRTADERCCRIAHRTVTCPGPHPPCVPVLGVLGEGPQSSPQESRRSPVGVHRRPTGVHRSPTRP